MSSNLFNEWPLWYYFANHKKNIAQYTPEFRRTNPPEAGIHVQDDEFFNNALGLIDMYDFMADKIVTSDDIPNLWIVTLPALMNRRINVPSDAKIVTKGVIASTGRGGEIIPLVGTPDDVRDAINAIIALNRGEVATTLQDLKRRANLDELRQDPSYQNPIIKFILDSFAKTTSTLASQLEEIEDLKKKLETRGPVSTIPNRDNVIKQINRSLEVQSVGDKAINISTGIRVASSGARYQIQEMMLTPIKGDTPRNVKIAIPNSLSLDLRQEYLKLIEEVFKAQKVESTTISERERELILFRPLNAVSIELAQLFDKNESFENFMNRAREISLYPAIDTTLTLGTESIQEEEEEGFDELEEEEEDIENY